MHYDARDQHDRFRDADDERTRWILSRRAVRRHERALARCLQPGRGPVLELGAGEGLTLHFAPALARLGYVGSDLHLARARAVRLQAAARGLRVDSLACDAAALPFGDGTFGTVLCRDLLHHLPPAARARAVREVARVLAPDGQLSLIEPNAGRSPLVALFSALIPTERMALGFCEASLRSLLEPCFAEVAIDHVEPSMLYRALLHHRLGWPGLDRRRPVRCALAAWERACRQHAPPALWTYLRARCRGPRLG